MAASIVDSDCGQHNRFLSRFPILLPTPGLKKVNDYGIIPRCGKMFENRGLSLQMYAGAKLGTVCLETRS